jgi:hypothetical protein
MAGRQIRPFRRRHCSRGRPSELGFFRSARQTPGREAPRFPRVIQADPVAIRIAKNRLPPQPFLILRILVELDTLLAKFRAGGVEVSAFEVDHGIGRRQVLNHMQRKCGAAVMALEAGVLGECLDDLRKPQALIERHAARHIHRRQGHLIQIHVEKHSGCGELLMTKIWLALIIVASMSCNAAAAGNPTAARDGIEAFNQALIEATTRMQGPAAEAG